jgi:hypothetical protein
MLDSLLSINSELVLIFALGALLTTLGFMWGSLWVSEVALGFAVAHLVLQFAPLSSLPGIVATVVGVVPFFSGETVLFVLLVVFGWWVTRSTVLVVQEVPSFSKILTASLGTLGIIFLSVSHTVSLGSLYAPGPIAQSIFAAPLEALLFVIASLGLVGLSRKM